MNKYIEYVKSLLKEDSPRAVKGSWDAGYIELNSVSSWVVHNRWELLQKEFVKIDNKILSLYKVNDNLNNGFVLYVGYFGFDDNYHVPKSPEAIRFITISFLGLGYTENKYNGLNYDKPILEVSGVSTLSEFEGRGIAKRLYTYVLDNLNSLILCDSALYFGARKLWKSFSLSPTVIVDVVDINDMIVVKDNLLDMKQGEDEEFDERFYSQFYDKDNIRFILRR